MKTMDRKQRRRRVHARIRRKVQGSASRPRLAVYRSIQHIYAQAIDDEGGRTLAQASTVDKELRGKLSSGGNLDAAKAVGELLGSRMKALGLGEAVFDRGGYVYHGRIKALADAAREQGIKF